MADHVEHRPESWIEVVIDRARTLHQRLKEPTSPRIRRVLLTIAAVVFFGGGYVALRSLEVELGNIRWVPLSLAALVGVPLTSLANTGEYVVSARILGHSVGFVEALRVNVLSTAANLLPIPGAAMVRIQALREKGSGYGKAASSTAVVGTAWIAVSAWLAGGWLIYTGRWLPGALFLLVGSASGAVSYLLLSRHAPAGAYRNRLIATVLLVEGAAVVFNALRLVLIFYGLNVEATFAQAFVLALSSSLSSLAGVLPGGFGLREAIAAALSPLVGLPPSAGFATTAVNRVLGIVVHAPLTVVLAFGPMGSSESPPMRTGDNRLPRTHSEDDRHVIRIDHESKP